MIQGEIGKANNYSKRMSPNFVIPAFFILAGTTLMLVVCLVANLDFSRNENNNNRTRIGADLFTIKSTAEVAQRHILCRIFKESTMLSNKFGMIWDEENMSCSPVIEGEEGDASYKIDLPSRIEGVDLDASESGSIFVMINRALIIGDSVVGFEHADLKIVDTPTIRQRDLQASGSRSVLVLRVSVSDSEPEYTATEFRDRIFGYGEITMQSQYFKCSAGQLIMHPSAEVQDGILEVSLPEAAISDFKTNTELSNAAQEEAARILNLDPGQHISSLADHIMICLPPGTGNWVAAAASNHWRSIYNNKFCGILSASMHELGHNLGLQHANQNGNYNDFTSYMSAGHFQERYPQKCFNAENHYHLGWFSDRTRRLRDIDEHVLVELASFIDYRNLGNDQNNYEVVVSIDDQYFLQFNRARSFNWEVEEEQDKIVIVEKVSGGTELLAAIDMNTPIARLRNSKTPRSNVVVSVCETTINQEGSVDMVKISIGKNSAPCQEPTTIPGHRPSISPTTRPTNLPSPAPSPKPSAFPTRDPTPSPTNQPTSKPTLSPTKEPTLFPTEIPLPYPSESPSQASLAPTISPSAQATSSPSFSIKPTPKPSSVPSSSSSPTLLASLKPGSSPSWSNVPSGDASRTPSSSTSPTLLASSSPSSSSKLSATPSRAASNIIFPSSAPSLQHSLSPSISIRPSFQPTTASTDSSHPSFPKSTHTYSESPTSKLSDSLVPTLVSSTLPTLSAVPRALPSTTPSVSLSPTLQSSFSPSIEPSSRVSRAPSTSLSPSIFQGSSVPSENPREPTKIPTQSPSNRQEPSGPFTIASNYLKTISPISTFSSIPTLRQVQTTELPSVVPTPGETDDSSQHEATVFDTLPFPVESASLKPTPLPPTTTPSTAPSSSFEPTEFRIAASSTISETETASAATIKDGQQEQQNIFVRESLLGEGRLGEDSSTNNVFDRGAFASLHVVDESDSSSSTSFSADNTNEQPLSSSWSMRYVRRPPELLRKKRNLHYIT